MNLMQEAADDAISRSRTPGALAMSGRTIASPAKGQDLAAAYYERAIQADPRFAEAHVRLARLLDLKGRDAEGLDHIRLAIDSAPETAVLFYAHLFAARSSETLGQVSDADAHARSALELFPEAQSALLAASQTALHKGDVDRAQLLFGQLADQEGPLSSDRDPWIIYPYGPGRNVQTLLAQLWHATPTVH
jgi:tetratricopeptide (TPR) repeat protein